MKVRVFGYIMVNDEWMPLNTDKAVFNIREDANPLEELVTLFCANFEHFLIDYVPVVEE